MRSSLTILFLLALIIPARAQNTIGIPDIVNYTRELYNGGTQNRAVAQDRNGILYFANYDGLLSFDGVYWTLYPLPNKTVVRSLAIGRDDWIYAGGQDDFGYFSPDAKGRLVFTSLKSFLKDKNRSFSDIWNIVVYGKDVFFRCREHIFRWSNQSLTVYPAATEWQFLGLGHDLLLAQDARNGLLHFKDGLWLPFTGKSALPGDFLVTGLFPLGKDSSMIITVNTGLYILSEDRITPFRWKGASPLINDRILTAIPVNKDWIAVGTNLDGCYIISREGEVIQNLSRKEGLQNNNILSLFLDGNHNLWLGLDNGIDFIAYNNAIKHIYPEKLNEGLGYTSIVYDHDLYVGTSNGLYRIAVGDKTDFSLVNGEFSSVPGTNGSTWTLAEMNGSLLLGHHEGAFQVRNGQPVLISRRTDYWGFLPFSPVMPTGLVIAANDLGLDLLQFEQPDHGPSRFLSKGNLPGFGAFSQFMAMEEDHTVWVAHPYRGVYKITLDKSGFPLAPVKLYTETNGLPSPLRNHLFTVSNHIVVTTEKGVYEYNGKKDSFEPSAWFKRFFGQKNIRHLKEDGAGNIWFIEDKNLGVIDFSGDRPETIRFPELNGKMVSDFEHIYAYDQRNIMVGAEKGFYHINYEQYKKNRYPLQVKISWVRASGKTDSLLYGGYAGDVNANAGPRIGNSWNSLHFGFASPLYTTRNGVTYSYRLRGFDRNWSAWSATAAKDYANLPAGHYIFEVRAANNLGYPSPVSAYPFVILPPWWLSVRAYLGYTLLFIVLLWFLYRWQQALLKKQQLKYEEEQKKLQYLHQLELEKSEKEIVKLTNEKLGAEIGHKNTELASAAMHLVQKGELLSNIREELVRLKKHNGAVAEGEGASDELKKILRILQEENKMDKDWEQFAIHFDKVHSDFLRNLKNAYPALSPHELKICAYLRMNLSSKQIAQLENISVRGVEIGRYRLRKKLKMPGETSLYDFLLEAGMDKGPGTGMA